MISAIAGLGNPGTRYSRTRHNIGRHTMEALASHFSAPPLSSWKEKFHGTWTQIHQAGNSIRFLATNTFMNDSGSSVGPFCSFFSIQPEQLLIIHDELELPFGEYAYRKGGGTAGHNGLKSLAKHLGTRDFCRLRIGIGRPQRGDVSSHVLGRFSPLEEAQLEDIIASIVQNFWKDVQKL